MKIGIKLAALASVLSIFVGQASWALSTHEALIFKSESSRIIMKLMVDPAITPETMRVVTCTLLASMSDKREEILGPIVLLAVTSDEFKAKNSSSNTIDRQNWARFLLDAQSARLTGDNAKICPL